MVHLGIGNDSGGSLRLPAFLNGVCALKLCEASSFAGVPSVAVPTGQRDGLPTGVQVISRLYREDLALDAAAAVEVPLSPAVSAG